MGDMADAYTEEQEDLYFDHLAGHVAFPCDHCPYCDEEERKRVEAEYSGSRPRE